MKNKECLLYDFIEQNYIATSEEIDLVTAINGYNEDTFYSIIYARTGLRSLEQCNKEGYYISDELAAILN